MDPEEERIQYLSRVGREKIFKHGTYTVVKERQITQDHPFYAIREPEPEAGPEPEAVPAPEAAAEPDGEEGVGRQVWQALGTNAVLIEWKRRAFLP